VPDSAAIASEHARLYEAERRARIRLEHVQAVTDVALSHLELDDLLGELLARIRDILQADTCAILLLDLANDELIPRAAVGIEAEAEHDIRIPLGHGFAGRIAATKEPLVIEDVEHGDVLNPVFRDSGIKSLLGTPLVVRGEVIGVMHVGTLRPRTFTGEDVELLQLVADRAALGIERAHVHSELLRLDQMKLDFVAVASHELRAPAAAVYGVAMTLRERGAELSSEIRATLEDTLLDQADRLRRLIEQLLDLSKLDAKAIRIVSRNVNVRGVIEKVVESVGGKGVSIEVPRQLQADADPLVVERVLTNLLVNALSHGESPVVVRAERRDRHLRIAVEDAGVGIAEELLPRLFDRFERGAESHGSGLGLAIAKAYARAHGGDLVYDRVGSGTRFELVLPSGSAGTQASG
jgi:signal transduction histidine kinase